MKKKEKKLIEKYVFKLEKPELKKKTKSDLINMGLM